MDFLIEKALELYKHTARVPVKTILTATRWLEEKHRKSPSGKLAQAIVMHYLLIALRYDPGIESKIAREYCARAARWQALACASTRATFPAKAIEEN
jgi:hypothetical protein